MKSTAIWASLRRVLNRSVQSQGFTPNHSKGWNSHGKESKINVESKASLSMPIVSEEQLKTYIEEYLAGFQELKSLFSDGNLEYFFPKFLYSPFRIRATISEISGVAIEFLEQSQGQQIEVERHHIRIQDVVLPRTSQEGMPIFSVGNAKHVTIENLTLSTHHKGQFITIDREGDIEFLNVRFELRHPDKLLAKEVLDLRLFGSNSASDWTKEHARQRFYDDFNACLSNPVGRLITITRELLALPTSVLKEAVLERYEKVLSEYDATLANSVTEDDLQRFLAKNPIVLAPDAELVLPKYNIDSQYIPDFVVKHSDNYVLIELESPSDKLYVQSSGRQKAESAALRRAIVQTEDWQRWIRDNPSAARERLHGISSPEAWVIIGRKMTLDTDDLGRLREANETSRGKRTVKTYDDLLDSGRAYLANLCRL